MNMGMGMGMGMGINIDSVTVIRSKRNELLKQSDLLIMNNIDQFLVDNGVISQELLEYRQQLRDLTQEQDISNIQNIIWPELSGNGHGNGHGNK